MKNKFFVTLLPFLLMGGALGTPHVFISADTVAPELKEEGRKTQTAEGPSLIYAFRGQGIIEETGAPEESKSDHWWLNSGGMLFLGSEGAMSVVGTLPVLSPWRLSYQTSNSVDTDQGYRPQNILRLITKEKWENLGAQAFFRILRDNPSESTNRNETNGLFLLARYKSMENLYYGGLRVDGEAVIKKKVGGAYYTLASKKVFNGVYDRATNPNILPKGVWIGIRVEVKNIEPGKTSIRFLVFDGKSREWIEAVSVIDDGSLGGAPIAGEGNSGIRTDFMDVELREFMAVPL